MRDDFPGISTRDPPRYRAIYREERREYLREYNRLYAKIRRAPSKAAKKRAKLAVREYVAVESKKSRAHLRSSPPRLVSRDGSERPDLDGVPVDRKMKQGG